MADNIVEKTMGHFGVTKREYFIGCALTGLLAGSPGMNYSAAAATAIDMADRVIDNLNAEQ